MNPSKTTTETPGTLPATIPGSLPGSTPGSLPEALADLLYQAFLNPDENLRTKPLFFWNVPLSEMTTDGIREIVRRSYEESGYNGFGILPYWLDGYLSDEYFELYEAALDEGSKYGMQFSLYDEDGFPSYTAGGLFAEKYPKLTARRLDKFEAEGKAGDTVLVKLPNGVLMAAVAMNPATGERIDISEFAHIVNMPEFDVSSQPLGVLASSTYTITEGYEADKAFDGDYTTRWNAGSKSGNGSWLQINYGKEVTFDRIKVYEDKNPEVQRVTAFDVQYWDGSGWKTAASGKTITDSGAELTFEPVKAQFVRLVLRKITTDSASISEFEVYNGDSKLAIPESAPAVYDPGYYASSIYDNGYTADKAFDGDPATRWNAEKFSTANQWLLISYGKEVRIDSVEISEAFDRVTSYSLEYWEGGQWKRCASGQRIGSSLKPTFDPVTTTMLRLVVSTNTESPSISEFATYNGSTKQVPDNSGAPVGSYIEYTIPANKTGSWKIMGFLSVVDGTAGMDYLSEEAVAGYIEITHEAYYQRFKKYFENGTITTSFYDEPAFYPWPGVTDYGVEGSRMWTDDFNEFFASLYDGENPALLYPALWYDIGEDSAAARDKLMGTRSEMFAKNYLGQINDWCEAHGIRLMGHMLLEEAVNPIPLEGDLMLCFKYQAIPGVDLIGNYGYSQEAYKIVSSVAYNWDKTLVMCEAFGAMGEGISSDILYKSTIDLHAKGINLIVPHAVWYDNTKNVVYPPELSYRNPNYAKMLSKYNTYEARLASILQREGLHVADIALLYPIDDLETQYTFDMDRNAPSYANYMQVGEYLSLTARRDFTYIHPEVLDHCTAENGLLTMPNQVNKEQFRVVILPSMRSISLSNLEKIYAFWQSGGSVISVGTLPTKGTSASENARVKEILTEMFGADPAGVTGTVEKITDSGKAFHVNNPDGLSDVLDKALSVWDVVLTPSNARLSGGNLSYIHKVVEGRNLYYIGNSSDRAVKTTLTLRGEFRSLELWDPATGQRQAVDVTVENGATTITLNLPKVSSFFLVESAKTSE